MMIVHILQFVFLVWESIEDIRNQKLSINSLGVFLLMGMAVRLFYLKTGMAEVFLGMTAGVFMLLLSKVTNEAIGYGDGMVILIVGIYSGLKGTLFILYLAFIAIMLVSVVTMVRKGFCRNISLPFVPCILLGYLGGLIL